MSPRTIPKRPALILVLLLLAGLAAADEASLGRLSANPFDPASTGNPYGAGNPYNADSINNPVGRYGNPYSNQSVSNPYATDAPKLYDDAGNYRGRLSANPTDPDSVSNPYGRYGNPYSPDSINNPYGAGNPYRADSPTNPYGRGLGIYAGDSDGPRDDSDAATGIDAVAPSIPEPIVRFESLVPDLSVDWPETGDE